MTTTDDGRRRATDDDGRRTTRDDDGGGDDDDDDEDDRAPKGTLQKNAGSNWARAHEVTYADGRVAPQVRRRKKRRVKKNAPDDSARAERTYKNVLGGGAIFIGRPVIGHCPRGNGRCSMVTGQWSLAADHCSLIM